MDQRHAHGDSHPAGGPEIAIIGMSGRFPGAGDVDTFWHNIVDGVESFTVFSDEELEQAGIGPDTYLQQSYVRSRPVLDDIRGFDAGLFGYSPREAALADPQQRIFLECVWEALESAGYVTPHHRGTVGVFAGTNISAYLLTRLSAFEMGIETDALMIGNDKDALPTTVSYRLDLRGPSISVQTFCSSSLVAVHLASASIRRGECDMAIAGGVSLRIPDRVGYVYLDGGQASPDGHVRTFDAKARGSMFGDGAAVVVLKRLDRALADRDTVLAVIRGSAVNNDGALKFSYQAPSIDGQRRCVADAIANAGVDPMEISYVEAHGTATEVGDPMEVAALTSAFGPTPEKGYCVLGSIKPNVGHLDRASGATGLIKVLQSLRHERIPGTLNYTTPNPEIDFDDSPFRVTAEVTPWPRRADRRRIAGVSSLGMGGTNVHVIVGEPEAPAARPQNPHRWQVLPVSARSAQALDQACERLAGRLAADPDVDLGDVAYTLQLGRKVFGHRAVVVADSATGAAESFTGGAGKLVRNDTTVGRPVGFLLAGVGEQYPGMVVALYAGEPDFRADVDECLAILGLEHAGALCDLFVPAGADAPTDDLARLLGRTAESDQPSTQDAKLIQPAVFVAEYALARQLIRWGVQPQIMIGYSLGEYVVACLAGVLSLPDALRLVAHRAALIAALPQGAMLAVAADEERLPALLGTELGGDLDIAVRAGSQVVLAGPLDAIAAAGTRLRAAGIGCRQFETTHAFHSRMLAPAAAELTAWVAENVTLRPPALPYVSNVTGKPADAQTVTDPGYWARHMCETVEFGAGLTTVLATAELALVEIGPGPSLGALTRVHPACDRGRWPLIMPTLPAANDRRDPLAAIAETIGRLWLAGVGVDWVALHDAGPGDTWRPGRIPLPTYPFEHQEYWLEGAPLGTGAATPQVDRDDPFAVANSLPRLPDSRWVHLPVWGQTPPQPPAGEPAGTWVIYTDSGPAEPLTAALRTRVAAAGGTAILVRPGERFRQDDDTLWVRPGSPEDAVALLRELTGQGREPDRVVHLWNWAGTGRGNGAPRTPDSLRRGLHTLVAYARAAGDLGLRSWSLDVVTAGSQRVLAQDAVLPDTATLLGPVRLIPVEYAGVRTRLIDVDPQAALEGVLGELLAEPVDQVVGLRAGRRWVPDYQVLDAACADGGVPAAEIRHGGAYLVTGGLGGIGLAMAERLARDYKARLVLMGRTPVPPKDQWGRILAADTTGAEVRRRLEGLQRLAAAGAEVITVAGDVSRLADVRGAVAAAIDRYGALNGVLHCAGVPAVGLMQFKTGADMERVLAPKVAGTLAIVEALRDVPVDFLALFSSTTSATGGGAGQVDYCAANAFLDALALSDPLPGATTVSIDWCEWTYNGWTDGLDNYDEESKRFFEWYRGTFGLAFDDGWLTLRRVLAAGERHVVVSTQDFAPLVAMSRRSSIESHQAVVRKIRDALGRHPRPELSTAYVEPTTPEEQAIAEVWGEALGLEQVGVHDNFFELGGNSLVGMEIIAEVRKRLTLSYLPPHIIYQAPTVASLAESALATRQTDAAGDEQPAGARDQQSRIAQRRAALRSGRTS